MFFVDPRSASAERDRAALHPASTAEALAKAVIALYLNHGVNEAQKYNSFY
jgi:hypothetical protein